ncbi:MAG: hypothetical protein ABSB94_16090 [Syntrophorhabdales bacterium]|jgi:hypothetical protein
MAAVEVTPGAVNERYKMASLVEAHQANTHATVEIAVADSQYGNEGEFPHVS